MLPTTTLPATQRALTSALLFVLAAYAVNFLALSFLIGPFDYDHLSGYYELAWRFWTQSPGLPQYNPYLCGGRTLGGDPQLPIFSPLTALVPLVGGTVLIKLELLAQGIAGAAGLWLWLRRLSVPFPGRLWGLFLYVSGGAFVAKFLVGHVTMGFYLLFPLFFWLSYVLCSATNNPASRHRWRALYWFLFAYAGFYKPNFPIYGVSLLAIEATARSIFQRSWRPAGELIAAAGVGALADAVALLPAWKYFREFPRLDGSGPQEIAPYSLVANLLLPLKAVPKAWYGPGFLQRHEYSIFLGPVAIYFACRAKFSGKKPELRALLVLAIFSALLGLGSPSHSLSLYPYTWFLHRWPGFESIRVPTRLWFGLYLALVVFSAVGFRESVTRRGLLFLTLAGLLPLVANAVVNLSKTSLLATQTQWTAPREFPPAIVAVDNVPEDQYRFLRAGKHVLHCTDNIEVHRPPALRPGSLLAATPLPPTATVEAHWQQWHRIVVEGKGATPFEARFNMNHSPYWRWEGEGTLTSALGQPLTLSAPQGRLHGTLVFTQPLVLPAFLVSCGTALALGLYFLFACAADLLRKGRKSGTIGLWARPSSASG